ncbi:MAG: hypothetical protein ACK5TG_18420 [Planctomyces sp.]|jgi:hypothetical protein|nr:DUF4198 domain-containing protein [Planctomyces sp.]HAV32375.1 hypothetical protein [Planctomycetaceae bacterium]HBC61163.1 hypothetical protein [Planctomycetaceae bacterium]
MAALKNLKGVFSLVLAAAVLFQGPLAIAGAAADEAGVRVQDVRLGDGGLLTTRVVTLEGQPVEGSQVTVEYQGRAVAVSETNADGLAAFRGLRAGQHRLITAGGATSCRFWTVEKAPPTAVNTPAVVSDVRLVRGQFGAFNLPMLVYAGVAIAAVVIGIDARNDAEDANAAALKAQADAAALQSELTALEQRVEALEDASP